MRVLVVDQDSASNLAIARSLRERYTVDAVTNKGDCLDLLRSNAFEVIVAGERLADGSGLELLGQISKKHASVLRIFAADRDRLKLLRGRLGPFELFQAIDYPIDPERLIAVLALAEADQGGSAAASPAQQTGSAEAASGTPATHQSAGSPAPHKNRGGHDPRPRRKGAGTLPAMRVPASRAAGAAAPLAAGSHTPRPGRSTRGARKPAPVRFPSLEPANKAPDSSEPQRPDSGVQLDSSNRSDAGSAAKQSRPALEQPPRELDYRKVAVLVGAVTVIVTGVIGLGFKLFGASARPAPQIRVAPIRPAQSAPSLASSVTPTRPVPPLASAHQSSVAHGTTKHGASSKHKASSDGHGAADPSVAATESTTNSSPTSATTPPVVTPMSTPATLSADPGADAVVQQSAAPRTDGANQAPVPKSNPTPTTRPEAALAEQPVSQQQAGSTLPAASGANSSHRAFSDDPPPVVREAKLIHRVNPSYPSAARRDAIEGFVDVEITVSPQGTVTGASVVNSNPATLFDKSALAALRKWKYDPRFVDGLPAEARLQVHLDFKPGP